MSSEPDIYTLKHNDKECDLSCFYRHPFRQRVPQYQVPIDDRPVPVSISHHPLLNHVTCILQVNERNMCALSATLRSKPNWWTKYTNPEIRSRWKQEAVGSLTPFGEIPLKEDEVEYVINELGHFAGLRDADSGVEVVYSHSISLQKLCHSYFIIISGIHLPPHLAIGFAHSCWSSQ